jgi:hypothetical protein
MLIILLTGLQGGRTQQSMKALRKGAWCASVGTLRVACNQGQCLQPDCLFFQRMSKCNPRLALGRPSDMSLYHNLDLNHRDWQGN